MREVLNEVIDLFGRETTNSLVKKHKDKLVERERFEPSGSAVRHQIKTDENRQPPAEGKGDGFFPARNRRKPSFDDSLLVKVLGIAGKDFEAHLAEING